MSDASESPKQRTVEETLRESEEQLRLILENMEDTVSRHLPDSTILYVSPSCQSLTGYTPEELVHTRAADYVHPDDLRANLAAINEAIDRRDGHYRVRHRMKRKDGEYVWVENAGRLLYEPDGHLREIQCNVRDITERQRAEEGLLAWKNRYESAVESSGHVLYDWDSATNQVTYGGAIEHVLGYSAHEMSGDLSRWVELIHPDDRGLFNETIQHLIATRESIQFEYRVRSKDGAYILIEDAGQFIKGSHGNVTQMIGFVKDITERNRAEEERQAHVRILECLDRINRPIRETADVEQLLWDTVRTILSIFDCDRAWLMYPCDPDAPTCRVPVEATRSGYTGACELNLDVPMKPGGDDICRTLLASDGPATYGRGCDHPLYKEATEQFGIQSEMVVGVHPKVGKPWVLGLHQCSHARVWTVEERQLLNEIARRLADGLTSALTQRELRQSEERFRSLFENAPLGYQSLDQKGNLIEVNETWCRLFGYTKEEVLGRSISEFIHPDFREHFKENFPKFKSLGYILGVEFEMIKKDGSEIIVAVDGRIGYHDDGSFRQTHCVLSDITERKHVEEALQLERDRAQKYLDLAGVIFLAGDANGDVALINQKGCEVLGYEQEEIIGKNWFDCFLPVIIRDEVKLVSDKVMAGDIEPVEYYENPVLTKGGEERTIAWHNTALTDDEGKNIGFLSSGEDITDRKRAEVEREELIARLEAQNAELERFAYTVSHDLKSPLITIKGYVGMLRQDLPEADSGLVGDDLSRISNAADKMDRLLRDLLELSRIGRLVNPPENVSLHELAHEARELVHGQAQEAGVQVEISPGLPTVLGDRVRLLDVLQNLLDNAVKHMGEQSRPRIEIGSRRDGNQTVCYVRDNGIGIEPRYHEKVFGLFDQLDQKVEGTGIGLALAKRIVEVHGGRIWVESQGSGHGSTFCFTIATKAESTESGRTEPSAGSR